MEYLKSLDGHKTVSNVDGRVQGDFLVRLEDFEHSQTADRWLPGQFNQDRKDGKMKV